MTANPTNAVAIPTAVSATMDVAHTCGSRKFELLLRRLSQAGRPGRPPIAKEFRELIRRLSRANPTWGSPRIVGELAKLGIDVAKSTVERYRVRPAGPPSPTWNVFPFDKAPRSLLRDRDAIYGAKFRSRVHSLGIEEVRTAPRSPWQNPYVERLIGSIRRECLDHVIVMNKRHLKRVLTSYFAHYHRWRVHRSLDMDSPDPRPVQPPELGKVVEFPDVGGLQHHYERRAA